MENDPVTLGMIIALAMGTVEIAKSLALSLKEQISNDKVTAPASSCNMNVESQQQIREMHSVQPLTLENRFIKLEHSIENGNRSIVVELKNLSKIMEERTKVERQ